MIQIKTLSGKYKGKVRQMPTDADPTHILSHLIQEGCNWKIDFSKATAQENLEWG